MMFPLVSRKLSFFWTLFVSTCCFAATQPPRPEEILHGCAQAMGSPSGHFDVIAEGHVQNVGVDLAIPVRVKTSGLEDFRIEKGAADQAEVFVISRGRGWHQRQEQKVVMGRHTTAYFKPDHLPALICGTDHASQRMRVTYVGDDVVGSSPVFHLRLDAEPQGKNAQADAIESLISEYHIFIDQQSFLVLKTARYAFSPHAIENRSLWETLYSDYRTVNGVLMPFHIENFVSGQKFSTTIFDNISAGVSLSDRDFQEVK